MVHDHLFVRAVILSSVCLLFASCASGPKRENDSALDYLNGHNYKAVSPPADSSPSVSSLPGVSSVFVKRQAPVMSVSGVLLISADPLALPLKYQTIVLTRGPVEVARGMTDLNGKFVLAGEISNGSYSVTLDSDRFALAQSVEVSSYKTEELRLIASTKNR